MIYPTASSYSDATVSFTTSLMGGVAKSPKLKIIISTLQIGYDFFLSGEDKIKKNNTNMFASDKTNVAHLSKQKLIKDLGWATKPSPQEIWDSIKKDKEDSNNIDKFIFKIKRYKNMQESYIKPISGILIFVIGIIFLFFSKEIIKLTGESKEGDYSEEIRIQNLRVAGTLLFLTGLFYILKYLL
ncbi:hypothetical protein ACX8XP_12005 [Calditrichota bacterium LG25]